MVTEEPIRPKPKEEHAPEPPAELPVVRHQSVQMERDYLRALVGPEFRPILGMVAITVGTGTLFYRFVEGWSLVNALYFSVVTLATIGYGDFAPQSSIAKVFTICYIFAGVGILGLFLSTVERSSTRQELLRQTNEAARTRTAGGEPESPPNER